MEEKIIATLITTFISEFIKQSKELFKGLEDEFVQLIKNEISNYLEKQKNKYSYVKTLLRGNTPVFLYDIYYNLKINNDKQDIKTDNIRSIFKSGKYVTIIGDAGSGKTTLMKHLFLNSIYTSFGIPILVELRYLNDYKNSIEEYIYERIFENKLSQNQIILERLLEKGKFIFFLDGYDELNNELKQKVITGLSSFINKYGNNYFILTSRPYSGIEHMPLFYNYNMSKLGLKNGDIEGFIYKQLFTEKELADKIVTSITNNRSVHIQSFLTNPLLLSLYILTFQNNASIPGKNIYFIGEL
ncbi:hypothetical protein BWI97_18325 [Siphonobacter sp. BAB-5405]|uniref:NACHT domain-containing protein n=1 Tax=Siphonobacter sp. BAB-5405 TaxID=1864825 RepID=UPI000C8016D5|nr:NACHT domain-containing protein [Siphonobacter sp. BAB-5405]PMD93549.1 hypothetical protein BWI97_18325 [Siphonobacter sp. BAB-5405]